MTINPLHLQVGLCLFWLLLLFLTVGPLRTRHHRVALRENADTSCPAFSLDVPGRPAFEQVHTRTFGTPTNPRQLGSTQFLEEFEAHVAVTYFEKNSEELLKRVQGRYLDDKVQEAWELWCKAIVLTYARTRGPSLS